MSAINQAIKIKWRGREYRAILTFAVIEMIEQDFNIIDFDIEIASGEVDCEKVAIVMTHILNSAGANVTVDDIGSGMFSDDNTEEKKAATVSQVKSILRLAFPEREKKKRKKDDKPFKPLTSYPWKEFYKTIVGIYEISPSDFWKMTPTEAFLLIDLKEPEEKIGSFTVDEFDDMKELYYKLNGGKDE